MVQVYTLARKSSKQEDIGYKGMELYLVDIRLPDYSRDLDQDAG